MSRIVCTQKYRYLTFLNNNIFFRKNCKDVREYLDSHIEKFQNFEGKCYEMKYYFRKIIYMLINIPFLVYLIYICI